MACLNDRFGGLQIADGATTHVPVDRPKHQLSLSTPTSLEDLPTELIHDILTYCKVSDMVCMWHSSKVFAQIITPFMLESKDVQQQALQVSCNKGDIKLLRTIIIHYNADPSFFRAEKYWPGQKGSGFEKMCSSTLATTARRGHLEAFEELISLGARLDTRHGKEHRGFSRFLQGSRGLPYWRSIMTSDYAREFMEDETIALCIADQLNNGITMDLLRTMLARGVDTNRMTSEGTLRSALSVVLRQGALEKADLLVEYGADVYGTPTTGHHGRDYPARYGRPVYLPIFAAAEHMAETGSTKMVEWCLGHGVNINVQAVHCLYRFFSTDPLLVYLESVRSWPVETELLPIEGIKFFQTHGANLCLRDAVDAQGQDPWWLMESWGFGRTWQWNHISAVETMFYKWSLSDLHEPQFFDCVMYLIQQGSGVHRTHFILDEFGDSSPTTIPIMQREHRHPSNHPQFWEVARELLNRVRQKHNYKLTWALEFANLPNKRPYPHGPHRAITCVESVLENILLRNWGYWPQFYGTTNRLVLDMMLLDGADLNGTINNSQQTILHAYCEKIIALCKKVQLSPSETDILPICSWGAFSLRRDKIIEFVVSLVDKGADPYKLDISGCAAIDILCNNDGDLGAEDEMWLSLLAGKMGETRSTFLEKGPTPNEEVYQVDLDRDSLPSHDWLGIRMQPSW